MEQSEGAVGIAVHADLALDVMHAVLIEGDLRGLIGWRARRAGSDADRRRLPGAPRRRDTTPASPSCRCRASSRLTCRTVSPSSFTLIVNIPSSITNPSKTRTGHSYLARTGHYDLGLSHPCHGAEIYIAFRLSSFVGWGLAGFMDRRTFLRGLSLVSGSSLLPLLTHCAESDAPDDAGGAVAFRHGVASGDPLADRVILWTRVTPEVEGPVRVRYRVAADPEMTQALIDERVVTDGGRDYTVKVDPVGLSPGTTYYYQFESGGARSPVGRTRTLPVGAVDRLRLAAVSCSKYSNGYFNVYRAVSARADLDAVLHLGDYIYESGSDGELGRAHEPAHEIVTLADYRTRYAQYRGDPDLQECHRQHPFICAWDDHETANDSWSGGAENHQPDSEGDWLLRVAAATQAYHEWLPIRTPDPSLLTRIYRRFDFGDLAELVMLETRLFGRSEPAPSLLNVGIVEDPARTMLGLEQEAWLAAGLAKSRATWRVYGNQTMFAQLHLLNTLGLVSGGIPGNPDQWDGYAANRNRIFDQWAQAGQRNHIVLSGDIHTSWASELTKYPGNPLSYTPRTGVGSVGAEFVCPSVTSGNSAQLDPIADVVRLLNTHIKYVELASHGYVLLDLTSSRAQGEFWFVDTIDTPEFGERFAAGYATPDAGDEGGGHNPLTAVDAPSAPRPDAPPLAP
ncbi:alkaline phosphatase D family protein [Algiphilus sp. W345]|uniref:Alkaline phosphatase D family protein n=1 Tax=Banduia mediterranea TaxID=3075609 RepID=A0ABU2WEY5_9GAMM|nr:alkaline phosphatase D family protein [Algiphilus sp. W345]MDT0496430.1 alkaline phosphatase D family protein [Algiphilus sp. W345]